MPIYFTTQKKMEKILEINSLSSLTLEKNTNLTSPIVFKGFELIKHSNTRPDEIIEILPKI